MKEAFSVDGAVAFQQPASGSFAFALLAVGQIGRAQTQTPALSADMLIQPFETFPEQFHIRGETQVAFIASGIRHANLFVLKIRSPVGDQYSQQCFNIQFPGQFLTDSTDDLVIAQRIKRIYLNTTKQLIMNIAVQVFY